MSYTLRFNREGEDKKAIINIRLTSPKKTVKITLSVVDLALALMVKNDPVPCTVTIDSTLVNKKKGKKK